MRDFKPAWVEINLDHIIHNYKSLKALTKEGTKACAIIKANGYGHGSVTLAKALEEIGCDYFGVATGSEALELRNAGISSPLMCLAYIQESLHQEFIQKNIDIPLFSLEAAQKVSEAAIKLGKVANIHIKLDSGMSRVGLQCNEETINIIEVISKLEGINLKGLFTHFAKADEWDREETNLQFEGYSMVAESLKKRNVFFDIYHTCNSAGTIMYPEYHLDMVRIGISLYGHYPSDEVDKSRVELKPAMAFKSSITNVKLLEQDRGVGYGHKFVVQNQEGEFIATIPVGYACGMTRMLSGKVDFLINDKIYKPAGNICMDQSMIIVDESVKLGDEVTIFSDDERIRVERLAQRLGTINYEVLCMVQRRIPRVYLQNKKIVNVVNYLVD